MNYGFKEKRTLSILTVMVMLLFLFACGGGGGGGSNTPVPPSNLNTIGGVASKGLVSGGDVSVYAITASGQKGDLLETGQTDDAGNYSVDVDYDGPVIVEVSGGQYVDEATGQTVSLAGTLRAAMPALTGNDTISVTPLTELSVRKAEEGASGLTAEKITGANDLVSQLIGADILATEPTDCLDGEAFSAADPNEQNYAMLLAAISQMANTSSQDVFDIINDIQTDMDDGQMDATGADLSSGLSDFLAGPNNATGQDTATELESSIDDATTGFQSTYAFDFRYLQYRVFEDPANNRFQGWFQVTKDGAPVELSEVTGLTVSDASGAEVDPTGSGGLVEKIVVSRCDATTCTEPSISEYTGLWARFDTLAADLYTIEADFADLQTATTQISYPGQTVLPIIASATLQSQWVGTDLNLSWSNPVGSNNWDQVDQLRIFFADSTGKTVMAIRIDPADDSITIPSTIINQAMALGSGSLALWSIQTRAYDENGMNYARAYSDRVELPVMPANFDISFSYLQYRTYEDPASNGYRGAFGLTWNGQAIGPDMGFEVAVTNSASAETDPHLKGAFTNRYMWYNCANDPCTENGPITDTGGWGRFNPLDADTYHLEVLMDNGQTVTRDVEYTGQLALPVVSSATMTSQWNQGNLVLGWTNPTGEPNWDSVDQLRILIFDEAENEIVFARANPTASAMTIPSALLSQSVGLNGGSAAVQWQIQTRAYDANNMNYARGCSNRAYITNMPFSIDFVDMMYRNYENGFGSYFLLYGLSDQGTPIAETQMTSQLIKDPNGVPIVPVDSGFFNYRNLFYDCSSGTCVQSGPSEGSGFWNRYDWLRPGTSDLQIEMEDGKLLKAERLFPGQLILPYIPSSSMTANFSNGDLVLSWTNPVGDPDWDEVEQLRVVLYDDGGRDVLYVRVTPTMESVTIPEALVNQAAVLQSGSTLAQWEMQTRGYFINSMNMARGYSNRVDLP